MDKERWIGFIDIMLEVYELPETEREAYLRLKLAGQNDLLEEGLMLLDPNQAPSPVQGDPLFPLAQLFREGAEDDLPEHIGLYRVLEKIGEGGMGTVYLAHQSEPLRRTLAIKVMHSGLTSTESRARFDLESLVLANMDHPHIAHIIDSGVTDHGAPYFSMEYFPGTPINVFCHEQSLLLEQKLTLFEKVCQGVQHAHQKGVIHRDLKPSNILVMEQDGVPFPKIIDFGIAKTADGFELTENPPLTRADAMVGTMCYMSPEQVDRVESKTDTRSDIYGLGALLYELLCGEPPFDRKRFSYNVALSDQIAIIKNERPPSPSRRISDPSLAKIIRPDLDRIVEKAMSKEPEDRYATASELIADLDRYLRDEPVLAAPPHPVYRIKKFVRRNRVSVTAAAAVFLSLLTVLIISVFGLVALNKKNRSNQFVIEFVARVFKQANPDGQGKNVKVLDALQYGIDDIQAIEDVYAKAKITYVIAGILVDYRSLESAKPLIDDAVACGEKAFGTHHPETLKAHMLNAAYFFLEEKYSESYHIYNMVINEHPTKANRHIRLRAQKGKADVLRNTNRNEEAIALYQKTIGEQKIIKAPKGEIAKTLVGLGLSLKKKNDLPASKNTFLEAIELQADLGPDHSDLLNTKQNYADVLGKIGEYKEQVDLLEEVYRFREKKYDKDHEWLLGTTHSLAGAYFQIGRFSEAETLARRAWTERSRTSSRQSEILNSQLLLALILSRLGQFEEAENRATNVIKEAKSRWGPTSNFYCSALVSSAYIELLAGSYDRASDLLEQGNEILSKMADNSNVTTLTVDWYTVWAEILMAQNDFQKAKPLLESSLEFVKKNGPNPPKLAFCNGLLGYCLGKMDDFERGKRLLEQSLVVLKETYSGNFERILEYKNDLEGKPSVTILIVDGLVLELSGCGLHIPGAEPIDLGLPGNCQFSVDAKGNPEYRQTEYGNCAIVMSIKRIPSSRDCDTVYKGILVKNRTVLIAGETQQAAICDDGPLDGKVFDVAAYQIEHQ